MSSYLDRIRAYHDQTIAAGVKAGHDAKVVRLSLDLEAKQSIYHTHVKLARQARAAGRKDEAREQERKRALSFRAFINTARTAEHGGIALALLREREAAR